MREDKSVFLVEIIGKGNFKKVKKEVNDLGEQISRIGTSNFGIVSDEKTAKRINERYTGKRSAWSATGTRASTLIDKKYSKEDIDKALSVFGLELDSTNKKLIISTDEVAKFRSSLIQLFSSIKSINKGMQMHQKFDVPLTAKSATEIAMGAKTKESAQEIIKNLAGEAAEYDVEQKSIAHTKKILAAEEKQDEIKQKLRDKEIISLSTVNQAFYNSAEDIEVFGNRVRESNKKIRAEQKSLERIKGSFKTREMSRYMQEEMAAGKRISPSLAISALSEDTEESRQNKLDQIEKHNANVSEIRQKKMLATQLEKDLHSDIMRQRVIEGLHNREIISYSTVKQAFYKNTEELKEYANIVSTSNKEIRAQKTKTKEMQKRFRGEYAQGGVSMAMAQDKRISPGMAMAAAGMMPLDEQEDYLKTIREHNAELVSAFADDTKMSKEDKKRQKERMDKEKSRMKLMKGFDSGLRAASNATLMLNMSFLGIWFSFMGLFATFKSGLASVFAPVQDIGATITGGALARAFVPGLGGLSEGQIPKLVESMKTMQGLHGEVTSIMAELGTSILTDPEFKNIIVSTLQSARRMVSDGKIKDAVIDLFEMLHINMPTIIDGVKEVIGLVSMILGTFKEYPLLFKMVLLSVVAMPLLSIANIIVGTLASLFSLITMIYTFQRGLAIARAGGTIVEAAALGSGAGLAAFKMSEILAGISLGGIVTGILTFVSSALGTVVAGILLGLSGVIILQATGFMNFISDAGRNFSKIIGEEGTRAITMLLSPIVAVGAGFAGFAKGFVDSLTSGKGAIDAVLSGISTGIEYELKSVDVANFAKTGAFTTDYSGDYKRWIDSMNIQRDVYESQPNPVNVDVSIMNAPGSNIDSQVDVQTDQLRYKNAIGG